VVPNVSAQERNNADLVTKGRQVFALTCTQCHGASHTTIQRKPAAGWRKTVYTMISRGAPVLPGETEALVAYLTSSFGPGSTQQPIPAGGEIVAGSCGTCHPAALVFGTRKSESDWTATVKRMRSLGASMTDTQEKEILDYLIRNLAAQ